MAGVPGEDGIGTGLYGASRDERIVNGAADDSVRGGIPNRGQIDIAVKADEAESAAHTFQELDGLVRCDAMRWRNAREGGVDLRQTVRGAKGGIGRTALVKPKAGGVMGMVCQENRKQRGGVEK